MSEPQPIGIGQGGKVDVRQAIARASQRTGIDFQYLLAQAKLESSLDPAARAPTSSAAGLYQFTIGTWLQTLDRHGSSHGLEWAGAAIDGGRVSDPGMRAQIMALRYDADVSSLMAAELANDNKAELTAHLGREPDAAELYLAHFLGSNGARRFLTALAADPQQSAAALMPEPAAANRRVFYEPGGAPRSVGALMEWIRTRVHGAMEGTEVHWAGAAPAPYAVGSVREAARSGGPIAREFHAMRVESAAPARASMADTLLSTFAVADSGGEARTAGFVRDAYSKLKSFGL